MATAPKPGTVAAAPSACRCELTIPAAILEGYSCGRPDCWRAAPVQASFDAFVADLVRRRDGALGDGGPPGLDAPAQG